MPDLGPYALEVALAYAGALLILAALCGATWIRWKRLRDEERDEHG